VRTPHTVFGRFTRTHTYLRRTMAYRTDAERWKSGSSVVLQRHRDYGFIDYQKSARDKAVSDAAIAESLGFDGCSETESNR